jgi:hypothetical protein
LQWLLESCRARSHAPTSNEPSLVVRNDTTTRGRVRCRFV